MLQYRAIIHCVPSPRPPEIALSVTWSALGVSWSGLDRRGNSCPAAAVAGGETAPSPRPTTARLSGRTSLQLAAAVGLCARFVGLFCVFGCGSVRDRKSTGTRASITGAKGMFVLGKSRGRVANRVHIFQLHYMLGLRGTLWHIPGKCC